MIKSKCFFGYCHVREVLVIRNARMGCVMVYI